MSEPLMIKERLNPALYMGGKSEACYQAFQERYEATVQLFEDSLQDQRKHVQRLHDALMKIKQETSLIAHDVGSAVELADRSRISFAAFRCTKIAKAALESLLNE